MALDVVVDTEEGPGTDNTLTADDDGSRLIGGGGDDTLVSGDSDDVMNGGGGEDTVVYDYALDYVKEMAAYYKKYWYEINLDESGGQTTITSTDGTETDLLQGIEKIHFLNSDEKDPDNIYDEFTYVLGENNAVMTGRDFVTVSEDDGWAHSVVKDNDHDLDGDPFWVTSISFEGVDGMVTLNPSEGTPYHGETADGGYIDFNSTTVSYGFPENAQQMAEGESYTVVVHYTVTDYYGLESTSTLTITVEGSNDIPVITGEITHAIMGEDGSIAIDLSQNASDIDNGDDIDFSILTLTSSNQSRIVEYTIDEETGQLNIDREQFTDLAAGEFEVLHIQYKVTDSFGGYNVGRFDLKVDSIHTVDAPELKAYADNLVPVGDFFVVNPVKDGEIAGGADTTELPDGNFLVTWNSYNPDVPYSTKVYGQIITSSGETVGDVFQVSSTSLQYAGSASVTTLSNGGFVVSYTGPDADYNGIHGQVFDQNGNKVGSGFAVNTYTDWHQHSSKVIGLSDGDFVVVWSSGTHQPPYQDGSMTGVFGQRFDASGQAVGEEFQVNTSWQGFQHMPDITFTDDGGFIAVWAHVWTSWDIMGQRFDADGNPVGGEFLINQERDRDFSQEPEVTLLSNGNIAVTWGEYSSETHTDVFMRVLDDQGNPLADEVMVNTYTFNTQQAPEIIGLSNGTFVTVWHSYASSGAEIFGQIYDNSGKAIGENFQISPPGEYATEYLPTISDLGNGNFAVVWNYHQNIYTDGVRETYGEVRSQIYRTSLDEGAATQLTISASNDDVDGSESITYSVSGLPEGAHLTAGIQNTDGSWALTEDDLSDFSFVPPEGFAGQVTLVVTATATEAATGQTASTTEFINLIYDPVDNTIEGDAVPNFLFGGAGDDILLGLGGNDTLEGGVGSDTLTGGTGADTFIINADAGSTDTITDFSLVDGDVLDLSDLVPDHVAADDLTALLSVLDISSDGTDTTVTADLDQDGSADQTIILQNVDLVGGASESQVLSDLMATNNLDVI